MVGGDKAGAKFLSNTAVERSCDNLVDGGLEGMRIDNE